MTKKRSVCVCVFFFMWKEVWCQHLHLSQCLTPPGLIGRMSERGINAHVYVLHMTASHIAVSSI